MNKKANYNMESNAIFSQFKNLVKSTTNNEAFDVISISDLPHKLGVSCEGFPKFFVSTNNSISSTQNIIREMLSVEYNLPCFIVENGDVKQKDCFSVITLRTNDVSLQAYFIEIFLMMLQKISKEPSRRELSIEVENLITIFSTLTKPPRQKLQGLWAELLIIERSLHPETLINAWHNSPAAKYDFTLGRDKIEVKSTSSEERVHHFSLDQLNPSPNSRLLIASLIVRESGQGSGGLSVRDLYERICRRVTAISARLQLYTIMAETIGSDLAKLDNTFFDYTEASDTLSFYDSNDVPHIDKTAVPQFVSEVKFSSNLSHLIDIQNTLSTFDCSNSPLYKSLF
jgi:hypothetical protein